MKIPLDDSIKDIMKEKLNEISDHLDGDIFNYYGQIHDGFEKTFLKLVEDMVEVDGKKERVFVILTTGGGSATAVERYVNILRHHYDEVNFID